MFLFEFAFSFGVLLRTSLVARHPRNVTTGKSFHESSPRINARVGFQFLYAPVFSANVRVFSTYKKPRLCVAVNGIVLPVGVFAWCRLKLLGMCSVTKKVSTCFFLSNFIVRYMFLGLNCFKRLK